MRIATKIIDMFQIIIVYDVHLTELAEQGRIKMIPVFAKLACGMMVQIVTSARVISAGTAIRTSAAGRTTNRIIYISFVRCTFTACIIHLTI